LPRPPCPSWGRYSKGKAAKKAANYNASIAERNAGIARQQAQADAERSSATHGTSMGAMRAAYGASGITAKAARSTCSSRAPCDAELDKQNILYKGELRAMGYMRRSERSRRPAARTR
jgi:uncharacterized protein (DUF2147 family)